MIGEGPNLLAKTKVYTMGAMQYKNGEKWREKVKEVLQPRNIIVFDPYKKPFVNERREDEEQRKLLGKWMEEGNYDAVNAFMKQVRSDDLRMCDLSNFGIVQIIPEVPTWGTPEELSWFIRMKKPLFIFVEGGKKKCPLWVMGQLPHKYVYGSLDEVLEKLCAIDDGTIVTDSPRWRLVRKEFR